MKFSLALRRIGSLMTVAMTAFVLGILPATAFGQPAPAGSGVPIAPPAPTTTGTTAPQPPPPSSLVLFPIASWGELVQFVQFADRYYAVTIQAEYIDGPDGAKESARKILKSQALMDQFKTLFESFVQIMNSPGDKVPSTTLAAFMRYMRDNGCEQKADKSWTTPCEALAGLVKREFDGRIGKVAPGDFADNAKHLRQAAEDYYEGDQVVLVTWALAMITPFLPEDQRPWSTLSGKTPPVGLEICLQDPVVCGKISKVDANGFTIETTVPPPAGSPAGTAPTTTTSTHPWGDMSRAVMPGQNGCFVHPDKLECGKISKADANGVTLETPAPAGSPANTPATSTTHSWKELGDDNPALCLGDEAKCRKSASGSGGDAKSGKRRLEFAALASLGGFFPTQGQADTATLGQLTVAANWGPWATPFSFIAEGGVAGLFGGGYAPWHSRPANRTTMVVGFGGEYRPCFGEDNVLCWSNKLEVKLFPLNQGFLVEGATGLTLQLSRLRLAAEVFGGGGTWGLPAGENPTAPRADNPPLQGVLVGGRLTVGVAAW